MRGSFREISVVGAEFCNTFEKAYRRVVFGISRFAAEIALSAQAEKSIGRKFAENAEVFCKLGSGDAAQPRILLDRL